MEFRQGVKKEITMGRENMSDKEKIVREIGRVFYQNNAEDWVEERMQQKNVSKGIILNGLDFMRMAADIRCPHTLFCFVIYAGNP